MFIRLVVGTQSQDASWLTGVVTIARELRDKGELYDYEWALLEETFEWLNHNLPCPPFKEMLSSGEWTTDAVSWFRDNAKEPLKRLWDIVALLKEHGVPVRLITSERPGTIVYSDEFQIVAET